MVQLFRVFDDSGAVLDTRLLQNLPVSRTIRMMVGIDELY